MSIAECLCCWKDEDEEEACTWFHAQQSCLRLSRLQQTYRKLLLRRWSLVRQCACVLCQDKFDDDAIQSKGSKIYLAGTRKRTNGASMSDCPITNTARRLCLCNIGLCGRTACAVDA